MKKEKISKLDKLHKIPCQINKKIKSLAIFFVASVILVSIAIAGLILNNKQIKVEISKEEFEQTLVTELKEINQQNPEKLALLELANYSGKIIELGLGKKLNTENGLNTENRNDENNFTLQNLEFVGLSGKTHNIGFIAISQIKNKEEQSLKDLENLELKNEKEIGTSIAQNVSGEKAKGDYEKYTDELIKFLESTDKEKPQNLFLSAFAIRIIDGKPDLELIEEFAKRGYNLIWTMMAANEKNKGQNTGISFGNAIATRKKIDQNTQEQYKEQNSQTKFAQLKLRVPPESLSVGSKNLTLDEIDKMVLENSILIYTNPILKINQIDQTGQNTGQKSMQKSRQILGTNYFSYFSDLKMREENFEQIANYLKKTLLEKTNQETQILIMGDFNTMGNVDGRNLDGTMEQITSFLPNLGSSQQETSNFQLILDNINFKLWKQNNSENNSQNSFQNKKTNNSQNFQSQNLEYYPSNLPFRDLEGKKLILKFLNLTLGGIITNQPITNFEGNFETGLYQLEDEYFGIFEHPKQTFRPINKGEFEKTKKEKDNKITTNLAITIWLYWQKINGR